MTSLAQLLIDPYYLTKTHPHTLSLGLKHTLSLSLSRTPSLSHTHALSPSLSRSVSLTHSLSLSLSQMTSLAQLLIDAYYRTFAITLAVMVCFSSQKCNGSRTRWYKLLDAPVLILDVTVWQMTSLAQLLIDPYYRTFAGFQVRTISFRHIYDFKVGFNHNYCTFTLILIIEIVLCSEFI